MGKPLGRIASVQKEYAYKHSRLQKIYDGEDSFVEKSLEAQASKTRAETIDECVEVVKPHIDERVGIIHGEWCAHDDEEQRPEQNSADEIFEKLTSIK